MGYLSVQTMQERVRSALGNPDVLLVSDDLILQWLNQTLNRIIAKYNFSEFCTTENVTTSSGTAEYTMASQNILYVENVVNLSPKYDLKRCDEADYDLWVSSTSNIGIPSHYYVSGYVNTNGIDGKMITFFPTPNATYTMRVRYRKKADQLITYPVTNYSPLSTLWDHVLVYGAILEGWLHLTEADKASAYAGLYTAAEAEAWKSEYRPTEVPAQTGRTFGAGIRG